MADSQKGIRQLEADVLIVGGGLAALRAAIEAQEAGKRVIVASKGIVAHGGSSAITSAGFAVAIGQVDADDNPGLHYQDTMRCGSYLNDSMLVSTFCSEAVERFWELVSWGVEFEKDPITGKYVQYPSGDHSRRRVAVGAGQAGSALVLPLEERARGVTRVEHWMALDLMRDADGGVCGAIGLDTRRLELVAIVAKSTILATGGIGQLYPITSNPRDVTGDGLALAFRAGAALTDLEFVQFYPWRLISQVRGRMPIQPSTFVSGAVLRNAHGDRFMATYDPERKDAATRAVSARAIYTEILEGRGIEGGVQLDLSDISLDTFCRLNPRVADFFHRESLDLAASPLLVAPEAHFHMGGVRIDEWARSTLAHLYAVGEVAGGIHGSNRADSNALSADQVFGRRGGWAAATDGDSRRKPKVDGDLLGRWQERLGRLRGREMPMVDALAAKREVQELTWQYAGIIRSGESLMRGIAAVAELQERLRGLRPREESELPSLLEAQNMALVAELIMRAAELRTESRGAHCRGDHVTQDDDQRLAHIDVAADVKGEIRLSRRAVA